MTALQGVQRTLEAAQMRQDQYIPWMERQSWYFFGGVWAFALVLGLIGGMALGVRAFPAFLIATKPGCALSGGEFVPAHDKNPDACVHWGKPQ